MYGMLLMYVRFLFVALKCYGDDESGWEFRSGRAHSTAPSGADWFAAVVWGGFYALRLPDVVSRCKM